MYIIYVLLLLLLFVYLPNYLHHHSYTPLMLYKNDNNNNIFFILNQIMPVSSLMIKKQLLFCRRALSNYTYNIIIPTAILLNIHRSMLYSYDINVIFVFVHFLPR